MTYAPKMVQRHEDLKGEVHELKSDCILSDICHQMDDHDGAVMNTLSQIKDSAHLRAMINMLLRTVEEEGK